MLETGEEAPDFELPDQDGEPVRLSELRGRNVVLYFYPRADTPGCTTQACSIRDHSSDYEAANAVVLGVSPDETRGCGSSPTSTACRSLSSATPSMACSRPTACGRRRRCTARRRSESSARRS